MEFPNTDAYDADACDRFVGQLPFPSCLPVMAPIRLRHPKGVSTIQIPLDKEDYTVQDLLQEIYKATEILPSRQSCAFERRE